MTERDPHLTVANASGFPLQIAVENLVRTTKASHGWNVSYVEHSWVNRTDERSGFIDIVLKNQHDTVALVIECKRVRDTAWIFMPSNGSDKQRGHCKSWITRYISGGIKHFGWHDLVVSPATPEAPYCIVSGQTDKAPMLERVASELVSSTEALAFEERDYRPNYEHIRLYFNIIVTTAELKLCKFSPDSIALKDGKLHSADFLSVPFVRFRKQLTARGDLFSPEDYTTGQDPSMRKEHTVFVVNSESLYDFLLAFDVSDSSLRRYTQG
jgi:hypothetical protein